MGNHPNIKIERVTPTEMRQRFNDGHFWERLKSGEFKAYIMQSRVSNSLPDETVEILSQMVSYRDSFANEVARVHQYVRPDGSIAASGKPDPKRLFDGGILYRLHKGG